MIPSELIQTLSAVVSDGTFDAAARSLHVTPSAVSQRIKALERAQHHPFVGRVRQQNEVSRAGRRPVVA